MKLLCLDFDDTLSEQALLAKIKEILPKIKARADIKVGIVTTRSVHSDFINGMLEHHKHPNIVAYLETHGIKLDFISTTYGLYLPKNPNALRDNHEPYGQWKMGNNYTAPGRSDYLRFIQSIEQNDLILLKNCLKQKKKLPAELLSKYPINELISFEGQHYAKVKKHPSPKVGQIQKLISSYGLNNIESVMLVDDLLENNIRPVRDFVAAKFESKYGKKITCETLHYYQSETTPPDLSELDQFLGLPYPARAKAVAPNKAFLQLVDSGTGTFSGYQCKIVGKTVEGEDISLERKPAAQFLSEVVERLGFAHRLTTGEVKAKDAYIQGLGSNGASLKLTSSRVQMLVDSAKIYLNNAVIRKEDYLKAIHTLTRDGEYQGYHNHATSVCHAQKIDLLVEQKLEQGKALAGAKLGLIDEISPAILLLSTPALNLGYGEAGRLNAKLSTEEASAFVKNMFAVLFSAAVKEGYHYIAMPAAGLGVFAKEGQKEQTAQMYFHCLFEVAALYPELNILYHPAQYAKQFDEGMQRHKPSNVQKATKDVVFLADRMVKSGVPCALHNPSDPDVVFGLYDVGEYWKTGQGDGYVGEEHIASMSTAPLNSRGLNPEIYENPIALIPRVKTKKLPSPVVVDDEKEIKDHNKDLVSPNADDGFLYSYIKPLINLFYAQAPQPAAPQGMLAQVEGTHEQSSAKKAKRF